MIARLFFAATLLVFGYAGYRLLDSATFQVAKVEVRGNYYLDSGVVQKSANVLGANLFGVSTRDVEGRVLALAVPRDVTVTYRLPNLVVISIKERTAAYRWRVGNSTVAVADDGTVLGPVHEVSPQVVVVADGPLPNVGDRVDPAMLREATYLFEALPGAAGFSPGEVRYSTDVGIVIPTSVGIQIVVGDDTMIDRKLAAIPPALKAAMAQPKRPTTVDVRVPDRPIIR
jgi:cell division septal protein FtsQ